MVNSTVFNNVSNSKGSKLQKNDIYFIQFTILKAYSFVVSPEMYGLTHIPIAHSHMVLEFFKITFTNLMGLRIVLGSGPAAYLVTDCSSQTP